MLPSLRARHAREIRERHDPQNRAVRHLKATDLP